LQHDGACRDTLSVGDIPDLEFDQIASPKLAVDAEVEQRQFACSTVNLKPDTYRPNFLEFERRFLANQGLPARVSTSSIAGSFHDFRKPDL
jgi:hypothetical protein